MMTTTTTTTKTMTTMLTDGDDDNDDNHCDDGDDDDDDDDADTSRNRNFSADMARGGKQTRQSLPRSSPTITVSMHVTYSSL